MPKKESPSVGGVPGVTGALGVTGCTWSDPVYPVYPVLPGTGSWSDLFVADRSDRSLEEGLSTGHFDSDQGDLFYNSVPKEESPSGGFHQKVNLLIGGRSLNPILTDQVPREGPGGGGTVSPSCTSPPSNSMSRVI